MRDSERFSCPSCGSEDTASFEMVHAADSRKSTWATSWGTAIDGAPGRVISSELGRRTAPPKPRSSEGDVPFVLGVACCCIFLFCALVNIGEKGVLPFHLFAILCA